MAENPISYRSPPETIELARTVMRDIKEALTKGADGRFPAKYAEVDWDGMNMQPPDTAWQDMDVWQRHDLLRDALKESIWDLEKEDRQDLAREFVREDARQAMPGPRAEAFDALTTRLEAFGKEQAALAERFGEFVGDAYAVIARLAEVRAPANPDAFDRASSPGNIAGDDDMPTPEEWRKLKAEWTHDYGLRRLEDRGVKYEDQIERERDHAAACEEKRLPSPGELAEGHGGSEPPGPGRDHDRGR